MIDFVFLVPNCALLLATPYFLTSALHLGLWHSFFAFLVLHSFLPFSCAFYHLYQTLFSPFLHPYIGVLVGCNLYLPEDRALNVKPLVAGKRRCPVCCLLHYALHDLCVELSRGKALTFLACWVCVCIYIYMCVCIYIYKEKLACSRTWTYDVIA